MSAMKRLSRREWLQKQNPNERLQISATVGVCFAGLPWVLVYFGRVIRRALGPGDPAAILWWPVDSWHVAAPLWLGAFAGLYVGTLLFFNRPARTAALLGVAVIAVASAGATALSSSSMIKVYRDHLELQQAAILGSPKRLSVTFRQATGVEARCFIESRRSKRPIAKLAYVVYLPGFGRVDLADRYLTSEESSLGRLGVLRMLDAGELRQVPGVGDGRQAVDCLRLLRDQSDATEFANARALMRIDEETYLRLYAKPHESWNGRSDR